MNKRFLRTLAIAAFALWTFLFFACNGKVEEKLDFCERFKADQSNLAHHYTTEAEKKESFKRRRADFRKNWGIIEGLIESDQLSSVNQDSCFSKFTVATLIHIGQNYPEKIFNKKTIEQLHIEANKGNIQVDYLRTVLSFYKNYTPDKHRCKEMKKIVDYAILTWGVNENFEESINGKIEGIEYVDCQQK